MLTVIANLKGGSGKSTVAFNLAVWLAKAHREPMCFDLDAQSTLSDAAEVRHEEGHQPGIQVFRAADDPGELIKRHEGEVLVDVGAANLWAMRQAVKMADRIVVPVTPSQADVWSTQRFLGIVGEALKDGHSPKILGFINRADTHSSVRETKETEKALSMLPGLSVQKVRLGQRTAFRRSFSEGLAVFELERAGKAAQEFNCLAELLFPRLKKMRSKAQGRG